MDNRTKIMLAFGAFSGWAARALVDGKIDANEIFELFTTIVSIFGVKAEIKVFD